MKFSLRSSSGRGSVGRRYLVLSLLLTVICSAEAKSHADDSNQSIRIETHVSPVANLFYQLECLAGRISCSQPAYAALWQKLGLNQGDLERLQSFGNLLARYDTSAMLRAGEGSEPQGTTPFGDEIVDMGPRADSMISLSNRLRLAAYSAANLAELNQNLGLLMHPADTANILDTVHHFHPRFKEWWSIGAGQTLKYFQSEAERLIAHQNKTLVPAIARFYGHKTPTGGEQLRLHLMAHPEERAATKAEAVENHGVIEVLRGEGARERLGVIVHELSHYFFATMPSDLHQLRIQGAFDAQDSRATAAMALMNEALATAVGNGVVEKALNGDGFERYRSQPLSFYSDEQIDTAAKVILPMVEEYLDADRTIDQDFIGLYFSKVIASLEEQLDTITARLRVSAYVATSPHLSDVVRQALPRKLGVSSLYGSTIATGDKVEESVLFRHNYLNGIVIAQPGQSSLIESLVPGAAELLVFRQANDAACQHQRASGSVIYVVAVRSPSLSGEQLEQLLGSAQPCESAGLYGQQGY